MITWRDGNRLPCKTVISQFENEDPYRYVTINLLGVGDIVIARHVVPILCRPLYSICAGLLIEQGFGIPRIVRLIVNPRPIMPAFLLE